MQCEANNCYKYGVWFSHHDSHPPQPDPLDNIFAYIWKYFWYIYLSEYICGNVRQIIVTNARSGSLTTVHTHHNQPDPLDNICLHWKYICYICENICGNVRQIIVTNVGSGSLTRTHTHHNQPDPLDRPCPLTSPHLLLRTFYTVTIGDMVMIM